jgi:hypothetical protein
VARVSLPHRIPAKISTDNEDTRCVVPGCYFAIWKESSGLCHQHETGLLTVPPALLAEIRERERLDIVRAQSLPVPSHVPDVPITRGPSCPECGYLIDKPGVCEDCIKYKAKVIEDDEREKHEARMTKRTAKRQRREAFRSASPLLTDPEIE